METVREAQKKYCSRALTFAILTGFIFILAGQKPIGKGLILGTFFSIANFILIGETLPLRIDKSQKGIFFLALGSIVFRYALLALPIGLAIKHEQFHLPAVILGIFLVQITLLLDQVGNRVWSRLWRRK